VTVQFFWVPPIISGTGKATDFKFCRNIHIGSIETKAHENVGNCGRGRNQGVPKIFRAPTCRAHCAVIFAIAQLSCYGAERPANNEQRQDREIERES